MISNYGSYEITSQQLGQNEQDVRIVFYTIYGFPCESHTEKDNAFLSGKNLSMAITW